MVWKDCETRSPPCPYRSPYHPGIPFIRPWILRPKVLRRCKRFNDVVREADVVFLGRRPNICLLLPPGFLVFDYLAVKSVPLILDTYLTGVRYLSVVLECVRRGSARSMFGSVPFGGVNRSRPNLYPATAFSTLWARQQTMIVLILNFISLQVHFVIIHIFFSPPRYWTIEWSQVNWCNRISSVEHQQPQFSRNNFKSQHAQPTKISCHLQFYSFLLQLFTKSRNGTNEDDCVPRYPARRQNWWLCVKSFALFNKNASIGTK